MFNFLKTKKYWVVGMVLVTLVFILLPTVAEAQWWKCIGNPFAPSGPCLQYLTGELVDGAVGGAIDSTVASAISFLTSFIFGFFGLFLRLAGMLMNWSIYLSINKMSEFINISGVALAWGIIRDVMNIAFIFGIVYISITTILKGSGQGIKKLLSRLVLAAILVNFSFFFTGVIIDASNILSLQIYQKIINLDNTSGVEGVDAVTERAEEFAIYNDDGTLNLNAPENDFFIIDSGIAGVFMQHSQIISIFNTNFEELDTGSVLMTALFGSIFIFILTFVFLTVAALLLLRLVVLILLVITSPIAFLGMVFPNMGGHSKKWWKTLFDQALFAPAYMLMTLVVILVIANPKLRELTKSDLGVGIGDAINTGFSTGAMGVVVNYLIVIGLTIGSLVIAKKLASSGGGAISSAANNASKFAAGTISYGGRRILGGLGGVASRSQALQDAANQERTGVGAFVSRYGSRATLRLGDRARKGSFDARATVFGGALDAGKATGKGGEKKAAEERAKKKQKRREVYGQASKVAIAKDEKVIQQKADNDAAIAAKRDDGLRDQANLENKKRDLAKYEDLRIDNPKDRDNNRNIFEVQREIKALTTAVGENKKEEKKTETEGLAKLKEIESEARFSAQKALGGFEAAIQTGKDNTEQTAILSDEINRLDRSLNMARTRGEDTTYLQEQLDAKQEERRIHLVKARGEAITKTERTLYNFAGLFGGADRAAGRKDVIKKLSQTKEEKNMAKFLSDQAKKAAKEEKESGDKKDDDNSS